MRQIILLNICLAVVLLSVSPALCIQVTFSPRFSITEEYTDNLFLSEDNEEDEFITILSAGFTGALSGERTGLEISYDPAYSIYDEYTENNTWRHTASLYGWADMTRNSRLEIRNVFLRTEEPYTEQSLIYPESEDTAIEEDNTLREGREPYITNASNIRFTHHFGSDDYYFIAYEYNILENEDETLEDNDRHNPNFGLTYWFTPKWGSQTNLSYAKIEYDREPEFVGEPSVNLEEYIGSTRVIRRFTDNLDVFLGYLHTYVDFEEDEIDYHIYNPLAGMTYSIVEHILLSLEIGYFIWDRDDGSDNTTGMTAAGEFIKTLRRGSITLNGSTGYHETYTNAENLGLSEFYALGSNVEYELYRNLHGTIYTSYRQDRYEDRTDRRDWISESGVELRYVYNNWLSFSLEYAHRRFNSTVDANDYRENSVIFRIEVERDQPYRIVR